MTIQTENLILASHLPRYLRALLRGPQEFANIVGLRVADGIREEFLSASSDFIKSIENAREPDPWQFGFGVIHRNENILIGVGGFPGPPDSDGVAEIAYGIALAYQGKGYATEVANALVDFASRNKSVRLLRAHTLAETNASTRVLEKCGFKKLAKQLIRKIICRFGGGSDPHACHPERSEGSHNRSDRHTRKLCDARACVRSFSRDCGIRMTTACAVVTS